MIVTVRRVAPSIALLLIFAVDAVLRRVDAPLLPTGLLDETGHLMTGLLCLGALMPRPRLEWLVGVAIGSTLIDLDHIPLKLGWDYFSRGTDRPYSHSLLTIVIAAAIIPWLRVIPRTVCWSVALGVATHLPRDMATGGVPLFWPITKESVTVPYQIYASLLIILAVLCTVRQLQPDPVPDGAIGDHAPSA